MNDPARQAKVESILLILCPLGLAFSFVTSLAGSSERGSRTVSALSLLIPLVVTVCAIVLGMRVLGRLKKEQSGRGQAIFFMVLAVVAGVGTLALRMGAGGQSVGAETSHLAAALRPTPVAPDAATAELEAAVKRWHAAIDATRATRWREVSKQNMAKLHQLEREHLHTYRAAERTELDSVRRVRSLVAQLESRGSLAAVTRDLEARQIVDPGDLNPSRLRLHESMSVITDDFHALLEANWEDWRAHGFPAKGAERAPWHKEGHAVLDKVASLSEEFTKIAK